MSIIDSFDNKSEALINPKDVYKKSNYDINALILNFSHKIVDALKEDNMLIELEDVIIQSANGRYPVYKIKDTNIATVMAPVGGPMASTILDEVCYCLNIKKVILFGSCGALDKDLTAGKLIVPSHSYRDEGTSYHYIEPSDFIEIKHSKQVCNVLDSLNIDYVYGKIWTTDAFYRETINNIQKKKNLGCIAVEMEIASCEAVCQFRNYEFYPFIYSADLLESSSWDVRILADIKLDERLKHFFIALEIAKSL